MPTSEFTIIAQKFKFNTWPYCEFNLFITQVELTLHWLEPTGFSVSLEFSNDHRIQNFPKRTESFGGVYDWCNAGINKEL